MYPLSRAISSGTSLLSTICRHLVAAPWLSLLCFAQRSFKSERGVRPASLLPSRANKADARFFVYPQTLGLHNRGVSVFPVGSSQSM